MNGVANSAEDGFQEVVLLRDHMVATIPDDVKFEEAAVIPLGTSMAPCGLYQKDHLAMALPRMGDVKKEIKNTVLIWGDSTSLGAKHDSAGCCVWA
jgi:NADPH:quinone reductase-like Zn-dependent oxidoreductase